MTIPSQPEFIQYLAALAPEGETLLVVQQKPVVKNGELARHLDGSQKYVWLPQLPDKLTRAGLSWFANTGSFILDRMQQRLSASKNNCTHVLCMMLDDIGTKSKTPPLEPTWVMETSAGNYQYGYVFSEQPTKERYVAAITAIAKAGYSDPGATNAVRNFRLPGSVNLKPTANGFVSRLTAFSPDVEYTLDEILQALSVDPATVSEVATSYQPVHLKGHESDPILQWLDANNLVLSQPNSEGWLDVVCPNNAAHTDGTIAARYHPADHGFFCFHGHCEELTTETFLNWVRANGGPDAAHGVRGDLVASTLSGVLRGADKPEGFGESEDLTAASAQQAEDEKERESWFDRYVYVKPDDAYFDTTTRAHLSRKTFNALHAGTYCRLKHSKRKCTASTWFDERRVDHNAKAIDSYIYAPGRPAFFEEDGAFYGNLWRDYRVEVGTVVGGPDKWLRHVRRLVPDQKDREHVLDVMAFKLQNPGRKINHAVLHVSQEGCGKDSMWLPWIYAICGRSLENYTLVDNSQLDSNYSYHVESEIMVFNELKEPTAADRRVLANKLKPLIAAPPPYLEVRKRYLHPYKAANTAFVLAFSNESVPLSLSSEDRRWFCIESAAPKMTEEESAALWAWYESGGLESVAAYLQNRDVSSFRPEATPRTTDFKRAIIEGGMSTAEAYLVEQIIEKTGEFAQGVIASPFITLCDQLSVGAPNGVRIVPSALFHALKEAGWRNLGLLGTATYPHKRHVWVAPDKAHLPKGELRESVEKKKRVNNVHNLYA